MIVIREATAWDLIGFDEAPDEASYYVRIKGGRALYEAVMYNDPTGGKNVKLARLDVDEIGLKEVTRYVDPDTILEVVAIS